MCVAAAFSQVAAECLCGADTERHRPRPPTRAEHLGDLLAYIDVVDDRAGHLGAAHTGVDEEPDDRVVAPLDERLPRPGAKQRPQLVFGQHPDRLVGDGRRLHLDHR